MKILSLKLVGNTRLMHSGTREIHYTPQADIQLIIGTNGSGKSTVLNELSPLPALKNDYEKGGSKVIVIYDRGFYYHLESSFDKNQKHLFIRSETMEGLTEENNLNEGHTLTIQKQLVETYFRYTNEIHELLLGNIKLTQLSPQKRKEWFIKLCNVDVTYAVEVYQRLQTNARNVIGAKKHTEQKLLEERSRLLTEEEMSELQTQINKLTKLSRQYSEAKTPVDPLNEFQLSSLISQYEQNVEKIRSLSYELVELSSINLHGAADVGELRDMVEAAGSSLGRCEERINSLKREYESIDELVSIMSTDDGRSLDDLKNDVIELDSVIASKDADAELLSRDDLNSTLKDASSITDALDELLMKMPVNKDRDLYNRETVLDAEQSLQSATNTLDKALFAISSREMRIDELSRHSPTECPNCNHVWIPGVSENEVERLKADIERIRSKMPEYELVVNKAKEFLSNANNWKEHYAQFCAYVRDYPRLNLLWDSFTKDDRILNRPSSLVGETRRFLSRLNSAIDLKSLIDRRDLLMTAISQREQVEGDKGKVLTQRAQYLEQTLLEEQRKLENIKASYVELKSTYDTVMTIGRKREELQSLLDSTSKALIRKDQHIKNELLDKEIESLMLTLYSLTKRMNDAVGKTQIVEHLEKTLAELTLAETDFKVLLQNLSPTEGLIADSLMGFIHTVTSQMNFIIGQIWTTPLRVLPCHTDSTDLDYKFPLSFGGNNPVADVALGSRGQKELVDYVFVLIAMIYLDLKDYPLLMDEVGHSFHDTHRVKLFDYIKRLLEQGTVGQVFVVSHFSNTHGTLTHADVNVIDNTGVMVPPNANQHFIIK